ncbi:MAG: cytochrome C oxidase subunit IV family protein, partial [Verrucomicrobiota bacterium]
AVAATKASLVAVIFMHLNHERGLIYKMLVFTVLFFISLMALTLFAEFDPIVEQYDTLETTSGKLTEQD